ncbi:MAG: Gfo/Idh/MocA family oxidoreductase [Victivallales bacterium]|jgi:predicted dehydrogenase|nr:Gfo/Idh/MocA family oxidoreductase [Victivallales bacterium]MBT7304382.1 Gfo/Idh/MocA family oxidoreductase [Victivallales bacterium]
MHPGVSRRHVLKAGGACALAMPFVAPRLMAASANDVLNVGMIGIGGMGNGHLGRCLGHAGVRVVAVCEVDAKRRRAARDRVHQRYAEKLKSGAYKGCAEYGDFRELLARDDIDAVMIATPDHWHTLISMAAARAGKDIYCEKPLTLTIGESKRIIEVVRQCGTVFQTGSQQRSGYSGKFRFASEMVRSGRIGELKTCHVSVGGPSGDCFLPAEATPDWMDWDMWLGPAPVRPFSSKLHPASWRGYRDYSGGGMTDWGAHHFDICQWALDADTSGPVEILPPGAKGAERLTFRYANGVEVYHGGYTGQGGNGITFTGSKGKIEVSRSDLKTFPGEIMRSPIGPDEVQLYRSGNHFQNWLDCIRTRRRPVCDVEIGARSVTVCHLGNLAYWLKRPLRWNPKAWDFVDDPGASRWIDRPMRAPWSLA